MTRIDCLFVRFHQQDATDGCGPAAAQMILEFLGLDPPKQGCLDDLVPDPSHRSGMSPLRLRSTLNLTKGSYSSTFVACYDGAVDVALSRIVGSISARRMAVPTVVWGDADTHWVVVTGLAFDPARAKRRDGLVGLFIHDPLPPTPRKPTGSPRCHFAPPHDVGDCCGTGSYFGSGHTYISLDAWKRHFWNAFYVDPAGFEPRGYVSLIAENDPPPGEIRKTPGELRTIPVVPGAPTIDAVAAVRAAADGLIANGLALTGPLVDPLRGVDEFYAESLSYSNDEPYFRVTLSKCSKLAGSAYVDGRTGTFFGVQAPWTQAPPPFESAAFALAALHERAAKFNDTLPAQLWADRFSKVRTTLFWQPCLESMSPFQPLVRVELGDAVLYVGPDGRVHRNLTPHR